MENNEPVRIPSTLKISEVGPTGTVKLQAAAGDELLDNGATEAATAGGTDQPNQGNQVGRQHFSVLSLSLIFRSICVSFCLSNYLSGTYLPISDLSAFPLLPFYSLSLSLSLSRTHTHTLSIYLSYSN